ncbi:MULTISPECIES: aldolase/citrate lyase family protein [unclassified Streptomyces]|uniref:HpcH/HpaI aldolase family protein n=1 Tax=unclassified Streptomyces TaxID=2593676 RepID=UPI002E80008E|nr:aldolase/citrate lyase family protein [Streptomyces sp. NBC_00589]WTI33890.1 aldolase/citrate lyase family protein [Streptomyces sp. NBC_00775]WUB32437.1 aldolase/citrate lyase family protein [Streptomyces sp. NBC_00589]
MTAQRLNRVVAGLAAGQHVFASFAPAEPTAAIEFSTTPYDALVFETEHKPWDAAALRDSLQYLLNRRQIFTADGLTPALTPLVRIPANGGEKAQWHAKQVLDLGAYGVVWPHISTVEEARNAVAACRYPSLPGAPRHEPAGLRGDSPAAAARYWGLSQQEYYVKSDVWPLDPDGEILVALMIEDQLGVANLPRMLDEVPGIGLVIVGEGDMSQELGVPRQYDHPRMTESKRRVLDTCHARDIAVGHPHVTADNVEQVLGDGYRFLMSAPVRSHPGLDLGRALTGRS